MKISELYDADANNFKSDNLMNALFEGVYIGNAMGYENVLSADAPDTIEERTFAEIIAAYGEMGNGEYRISDDGVDARQNVDANAYSFCEYDLADGYCRACCVQNGAAPTDIICVDLTTLPERI